MPADDNLTPRQAETLSLFASFIYLTSFHVRHLTGRTEKPVERDLRFLELNGYLDSRDNPNGKFLPRVLFLRQKGWDWAFKEKLIQEPVRATSEKGTAYLPHDLVLTELHIKLFDIFGKELFWSQLRQDCYRRFGKGVNDRVNMDAFCSFPIGGEFAIFAVEAELSKDSVKQGKSSRMEKVDAYEAYARGPFQEEYGKGADFRVLWTFGSEIKVLNFGAKVQEEKKALRRHWILDETLIPTLTKEAKVFVTPKDIAYEPERKRFYAQQYHSLSEA